MKSKIKQTDKGYKLTIKNLSHRELELLWGMLNATDRRLTSHINKGFENYNEFEKAQESEVSFIELWDTLEKELTKTKNNFFL